MVVRCRRHEDGVVDVIILAGGVIARDVHVIVSREANGAATGRPATKLDGLRRAG